MAAGSLGEEITTNLLKCMICYEAYTNPRVLPCQHTFCYGCLQQHIRIQNQQHEDATRRAFLTSTYIKCPTCREQVLVPHNGVDGFRHDFKVARIAEIIRSTESCHQVAQQRDCEVCTVSGGVEIASTNYCSTCARYFCSACSHRHRTKAVFADHKLAKLSQDPDREDACDVHKHEKLEYFCQSCLVSICGLCAMTDHDTHDVMDLTKCMENYRNEIKRLGTLLSHQQGNLASSMAKLNACEKQLQQAHATSTAALSQRVEELVADIKEQERHLRVTLKGRLAIENEAVKLDKDKIEFRIVTVRHLQDIASTLMVNGVNPRNITAYDELIEKIRNTLTDNIDPTCQINNDEGNTDGHVTSDNEKVCSQFAASEQHVQLGKIIQFKMLEGKRSNINVEINAQEEQIRPQSALHPSVYAVSGLPRVKFLFRFGRNGDGPGEFNSPRDVAIAPDGCMLIADTHNNRIQVFDHLGNWVKVIGEGQVKPWGLAVTAEGNIAVTDALTHTVKILNRNGKFLHQFGDFACPCGIACGDDGQLVVTDFFSKSASIHDSQGAMIKQFTARTNSDTYNSGASRVTVDKDGRIIISDIANHSIKIFDKGGKILQDVSRSKCLESPQGVATDDAGHIIVADGKSNQIVMLAPNGKFLKHLLPKQDKVKDPTALTLSPSGVLVVTQSRHDRVRVYQLSNHSCALVLSVPRNK